MKSNNDHLSEVTKYIEMLRGIGISSTVDRSVIYFEEFIQLIMHDASDLYIAIMNPLN